MVWRWLGGTLKDAEIETFTGAEPDSPPEIEPVAIWFIEHDLSKPEQGFRLRRMLNGGGAPPRIDIDVRAATLEELRRQLPSGLIREPPRISRTLLSWRSGGSRTPPAAV